MPPTPLKILCFGASLTEGYTQHGTVFAPYSLTLLKILEQKLNQDSNHDGEKNYDIKITNEGLSGEKVCDMKSRITLLYTQPDVRQDPYDIVVFLGGTNDLGFRRDAKDIFEDVKIVLGVPMKKGAKAVVMTVPECAAKFGWMDEGRDTLNGFLKTEAEEVEGVYLYDLHKEIPFHSMSAEERKEIWDDGVHFTAKGYERVGGGIANVVLDVLREGGTVVEKKA